MQIDSLFKCVSTPLYVREIKITYNEMVRVIMIRIPGNKVVNIFQTGSTVVKGSLQGETYLLNKLDAIGAYGLCLGQLTGAGSRRLEQ